MTILSKEEFFQNYIIAARNNYSGEINESDIYDIMEEVRFVWSEINKEKFHPLDSEKFKSDLVKKSISPPTQPHILLLNEYDTICKP